MGWAQGGPSLGPFVLWSTAPRKNPGVTSLPIAPPRCNPGSLRIPGLFIEPQSVLASWEKNAPHSCAGCKCLCCSPHSGGGKKIKKTKTKSPPNLYLDEEYTGGPKEK